MGTFAKGRYSFWVRVGLAPVLLLAAARPATS
jgi:hypothetical protein